MSNETSFGETVDRGSLDIKVVGDKHTYGDGATRCIKKNKGRFDLIPEEVLFMLLHFMKATEGSGYRSSNISLEPNTDYIMKLAYKGEYVEAIYELMLYDYTTSEQREALGHDVAKDMELSTFCICKLMAELAIHFQKGAEVYGERNCQKGIPLWSFRDSGLRHMGQYFMGYEDENHFISAIWNFWMAEWTLQHKKEDDSNEIIE